MTALSVENPVVPLMGPPGLTPAEQYQADNLQAQSQAAKTLAEVALVLGGAFLLYRSYAVARLAASLPAKPTTTWLQLAVKGVWHTFQPNWLKITVPAVATAYTMGMIDARTGRVPPDLLYLFAEQYARDIGTYFNQTSAEALEEGFHGYVNRKVPHRAAADRVLKAYGLSPKQMRSVVAAEQLGALRMTTPVEMKTDGKSERFIETQLLRRASEIGENEAFTATRRAKQLTWMYLLKHEKFPASAKKIWVTAHDEKVCQYCGPLDGVKAEINEPFKTHYGPVWVPALHPNCRCDIILDAPTRELFALAKRFDPHQPRDEDGRWTRSATKLNSMPVVPGRVENRFRQARHTVGYVAAPRYLTTPIKERDRELAHLAHGAVLWSGWINNVDRARKIDAGTNEYFSRKMRMFKSDQALTSLVRAVADAPANAPTLYRGLLIETEQLNNLVPGHTMELPLSSFTADQKLATQFAVKFGPRFAESRAKAAGIQFRAEEHTPVLFQVRDGAKALHISPLVAERQAEWISRGKFTILDAERDSGLPVIVIEQVNADEAVTKAEWWIGEGWEEAEHPRDEEGRFTFKPQHTRVDVRVADRPEQTGVQPVGGRSTGIAPVGSSGTVTGVQPVRGGSVSAVGAPAVSAVQAVTSPARTEVRPVSTVRAVASVTQQVREGLDMQTQLDQLVAQQNEIANAVAAQVVTPTKTNTKIETKSGLGVYAFDADVYLPWVDDRTPVGAIIPMGADADVIWMDRELKQEMLARMVSERAEKLAHEVIAERPTAAADHDQLVAGAMDLLMGRSTPAARHFSASMQVNRNDHLINIYVAEEAPPIEDVAKPYIDMGDDTYRIPHPMEVTWIEDVRPTGFPVRMIALAPTEQGPIDFPEMAVFDHEDED